MIQVVAFLDKGRFSLTVTGHEDQRDGVVCAAVSAITQTALLGLQAVAEQHPDLIEVNVQEDTA